MPTRKDAHVRLTGEAYALLTEKAEDYNVSQKEIASEAIILLVKRENTMRSIKKKAKRLQKLLILYLLLAGGVGIVIGLIIGGML